MPVAVWIFMWLFAFIVVIEIFGRRYYGLCPPVKAARGQLAVHLSANPDTAREQLAYYLSWVEWNGADHRIVFVRGDDSKEIIPMFARFFEGLPNVKLVTKAELAQMFAESV